MNKSIVDFYSGKATDTSSWTLREIHAWGYHELETVHDYIQWLFPLPEPSQYKLRAPVLDAKQIAKFHTDAELITYTVTGGIVWQDARILRIRTQQHVYHPVEYVGRAKSQLAEVWQS